MSLCQNLYESIKNEPFKIPEDDGNDLTHTFFNPDREGWLLKLGECWQPGGCSVGMGLGGGAMLPAHLAHGMGSLEHGPERGERLRAGGESSHPQLSLGWAAGAEPQPGGFLGGSASQSKPWGGELVPGPGVGAGGW